MADVEIGPVRADEADAMLDVMCRAFQLPLGPIRDVFYADPYFDLDNKIALRVNGRIVSCLTLVPIPVRIGSGIVTLAGVANVATHPERQRQGWAGRLLRATLDLLDERGYALSGLFPEDYTFYRRWGWEQASRLHRLRLERTRLPHSPLPDGLTLRPATLDDAATLAAWNEHDASSQDTFFGLRDGKRWHTLLTRMPCLVTSYSDGGIAGCLFYFAQAGSMESLATGATTSPTLIVQEARGDAMARQAFRSWLAAQEAFGCIEIEGRLNDLNGLELLDGLTAANVGDNLASIATEPGVMLRIVNWPRTLRHVLGIQEDSRHNSLDFRGALTLILHDDVRGATAGARVWADGASLQAEEVEPTETSEGEALRVVGEARVWAQVVAGYLSGSDALNRGLLHPSSPAAAAHTAQLFPRRDPFFSAPDRF